MVIPWGLVEVLANNPEWGWAALGLWLFVELRTKWGVLYKLDKKVTGAIIVLRAIAMKDEAIDEDKVDEYLAENGMEPHDFITQPGRFPVGEIEDSSFKEGESPLGEGDNSPNKDERSA